VYTLVHYSVSSVGSNVGFYLKELLRELNEHVINVSFHLVYCRYVHVHVYRFDSPDTARTFVRYLNDIVSMNAVRTDQIERQLVEQGQIEDFRARSMAPIEHRPKPNMNYRFDSSDGMSDRAFHDDSGADSASFSDDGFPSTGSDEIDPDLQSLKECVPFDSVTDELKARLKLTETQGAAPLLLPPKDYDTIVRRHGDLDKASKRKCLQIPIVGGRNRNGSEESGIEVPSPTSSEGRQNSMDMSDDKISSSIHSGSNGLPTPPMSPHSGYGMYHGKPHVSRQNSSSGVSNRSSGISTPDTSRSSYYQGHTHITDIPPADYDDNEAPILRQKIGMSSHRDLTKSMPAAMLQREIDYGYAVSPKRLSRQSARYNEPQYSPRVDMDYARPAGPTNVRRVNSMYR